MAAFATSYIKTVASSVTRNADAASMTGTNFSSWFNNAEGTLLVEASLIGLSSTTNQTPAFLVGTSGSDIRIRRDGGSARTQAIVRVSSSIQAQFNGTSDWTSILVTRKMALAYATNNFGYSAMGVAFASDTSGNVPTVTDFYLGTSGGSLDNLNGCIGRIAYYPQRLTNAQLQALTG